MRNLIFTAALISLFTTTHTAIAEDWPQWLGQNRDGHSPESITQSWPTDGPPLAWRIDGLGAGYSTPAIANGQIIFLINRDNSEFAVALRESDGSKLWEQRIGGIGAPEQQPAYPGARSTPTIDQDRVYVMSSDGDLACLDSASGQIIWSRQLKQEFNGQYGTWAYSESPLIDGNKLICAPGGPDATVLALNKRTGEVIWQTAVPSADAASYASIITDESTGTKQYIVLLAASLIGVDPDTGRMLWQFADSTQGSPSVIPTPIAHDGYVYSGAYQATPALIKLNRNGNTWNFQKVYSHSRLPLGIGGMVLVDGYLYGDVGQGFACVNFTTGEMAWQVRAIGPCSVLYADGMLILHGNNGDLALVKAAPSSYQQVSHFTPPNRDNIDTTDAMTYPVIANGKLYIREAGSLWAYQISRSNNR